MNAPEKIRLTEFSHGGGCGCKMAPAVLSEILDALPIISEALDWVKSGTATGASERNWKSYGREVQLPAGFADWQRKLITDPQTSGGLLVACAPQAVPRVLAEFGGDAREIGRLVASA